MNDNSETLKQRLNIMRSAMESDRSSFIQHWRDLSDYILPRRAQFTLSDSNKGDKRNQKILDSTATLAARTLRSCMMSGVTSPARPWFRLTTPDPDLAEFGSVKEWLHIVSQRMGTVFLKSNLYNVLPTIYGDMGTFGTAAMYIEEDFDDVIRCYSFPIGSYMIATNARRKVDGFNREFRFTVRQLIEQFGYTESGKVDLSKFSEIVKNHYERKNQSAWIDVCHVIYPNDQYDGNGLMSNQKRYRSLYYEKGEPDEKYLSDKGYSYFPVLCPRWETTGEDVYGTECPGMIALSDVKALQIMQKRRLQAIEKHVNPPMIAPAMLKTQKVSTIPGDITYVDEREGMKGLRPAYEVDPKTLSIELAINEHQERISRVFYEDLFLMLINTDRREITAREIDERHEEKLLALGPVLEQLNQDVLDPLIDITFDIMYRQGLIPEPPEEIAGTQLKVEYISILAQAQKMVGLAGIERFAGFVGQVATYDPQVLDKVDRDQMIDEYGDITGVPPRIIVPDDKVAAIREGRAAVAKQQEQMAALASGAKTAKDLSGANLDNNNALTALLQQAQAGQLTGG